jgi:serine/threonine protein kinase
VDEEGQVKLIDFGIAARASVAGHDVFGTPGHMPPEQLRREEISPATDIFAVAVLLMELWSGQPPFRRKTPGESLAQMHAPHPKPSDSDPRLAPLDAIVGKAMALAPAERPQQADELGRALRKFLQDVDQGDLERALGERVRVARALAEAKRTKASGAGSLVKPSKPSIPDMGPKTFAVRSEALAWKAETPEEPNGTRRLPPSEHPPAVAAHDAVDAPKIETIATRPIETPVRHQEPAARASTSWKKPALAALFLVPALAWGALRLQPNPTAASRAAPLAVPTLSPTTTSPPVTPSASTQPPTVSSTSPVPVSSPDIATQPSSSSTPALATGQLFLIGDPGTEFAVDSAPFRPCPAVISVKAGAHQVRFAFGYATTHDSIGRQVTVRPGERVTVHADFTTAVPRVRIEH